MIYLDNNSTTPVDDFVLQQMLPYFSTKFGNASSTTHQFGWQAKDGVETASTQVARFINCDKSELVFTSGATESVNLAIRGVFNIYKRKGNHIITAKTEHKAVLDTCNALEKEGARITYLDVDSSGIVSVEQLKRELTNSTILVAIMYANNETGVLQPIDQIAKTVHDHNCIFMCDATQAVGKVPINLEIDKIDLMAFSAHKFYGPKGVGGLYIRRKNPRVILSPLIYGGGHQRGLRSGTLNVPGIVGLGAACSVALEEMANNQNRIEELRNYLEQGIMEFPNIKINGYGASRLYNTSNICFCNIASVDIINAIKTKIAISTGSACTSEDQNPSHVLTAMGLSAKDTYSSIRFSIGKYNTIKEIDETVRIIGNLVKELIL